MPKKLLLINPVNELRSGLVKNILSRYPPLSLGIIASLTPENWEIEILDENFEKFEFRQADFVAITSFTASAYRAYQIAEEYRKKGVKVVMGGIHASMLPDEALKYVDSVVVGEAEGVWAEVISDFENQNLQKLYKAEILEFKNWPIPRHDLFHKGYAFDSIQTSRGCPMQCDFCSVSSFNGCTYRQRPIDEVIEELKTIKRKLLFIVDDNIIGNGANSENRAIELFKRIQQESIEKEWFSHASINFANNEEVLKQAAASGCKLIFIGFEAEKDEHLVAVNKTLNVKTGSHTYKEITKKINKFKISVLGSFIMGMDSDTIESIRRRKKYMARSHINIIGSMCLTPLPGTLLYEKLSAENRIIRNNYPEDWQHYDFLDVVFKPKNMEVDEFEALMIESWNFFYRPFNIFIRTFIAFFRSKSFKIARWVYISNHHYRNVFVKYNLRKAS